MNSQNTFFGRMAFLSLLYLMAPVAFWIAGWFQPWVSIPIVAGMCFLIPSQYKFAKSRYNENTPAPKAWEWLLLVLVAAACVFICGFDGRLNQSWDFLARNPLYYDLINGSWPWQANNGDVLIYTIQFWLVPAFLSKTCGGASAQFLQLWVFLGIFLTMLNLYPTLGRAKSILFFPALLVFAPLTLLTDDILNVGAHINAIFGVHYRLPSALSQLTNTFHYFVPVCLFLSLMLERKPHLSTIILLGSMLVVFHPMAAAMALPLVLFKAYSELRLSEQSWLAISWKSLLCPELLLGSVIVLLSALYYLSSTSGDFCIVFDSPYGGGYSVENMLICLAGILLNLLPLLIVWHLARKWILLLLAAYVPILIIFWVGFPNGISEWFYKFSVLYSYCIIFYLFYANQKKARRVLILLTCISLFSFAREFQKTKFIESARAGFIVQPQFINIQGGNTMKSESNICYHKYTVPAVKCHFLFRLQEPSKF